MKKVMMLLRLSLAFAFAYAAIAGFITPSNWIGFIPVWLVVVGSAETMLIALEVLELVLAAWILFAKRPFVPSIIAALFLLGVVAVNWGAMDIVFRDVSLALAALALAFLSRT